MKGLPAGAITLGLLLSHEEGAEPLDCNELLQWFRESQHGMPGFIGSADTIPSLRIAIDLAELLPGRIKRVWPYPELSVVRKGQKFMHLATIYKIVADAQYSTGGLARFALAVTDSAPCMNEVYQWIGNIMGPRSSPAFSSGGLITLNFFPQSPKSHLMFQNLDYCNLLGNQTAEKSVRTPA